MVKKGEKKRKIIHLLHMYDQILTTLASQQIFSGHCWLTSETPYQWRLAGGPIVIRFCRLTVNAWISNVDELSSQPANTLGSLMANQRKATRMAFRRRA